MKIKTKEDRRDRIKHRIRKRVSGTTERPRLTVFRSLAHMYAQVVDDRTGSTIAAASSVEPAIKASLAGDARGSNKAGAEAVGRAIAERLKAKGITRVVFDRNGFLYHGRIKAIADAARQAGLEF
jgi:large subunit ribosomal protein L18